MKNILKNLLILSSVLSFNVLISSDWQAKQLEIYKDKRIEDKKVIDSDEFNKLLIKDKMAILDYIISEYKYWIEAKKEGKLTSDLRQKIKDLAKERKTLSNEVQWIIIQLAVTGPADMALRIKLLKENIELIFDKIKNELDASKLGYFTIKIMML